MTLILHLPSGHAVETDLGEWLRCFYDPEFLRSLDALVSAVADRPTRTAPPSPTVRAACPELPDLPVGLANTVEPGSSTL